MDKKGGEMKTVGGILVALVLLAVLAAGGAFLLWHRDLLGTSEAPALVEVAGEEIGQPEVREALRGAFLKQSGEGWEILHLLNTGKGELAGYAVIARRKTEVRFCLFDLSFRYDTEMPLKTSNIHLRAP